MIAGCVAISTISTGERLFEVAELDLASGERYRSAWWRKVVMPGLEELLDVEI